MHIGRSHGKDLQLARQEPAYLKEEILHKGRSCLPSFRRILNEYQLQTMLPQKLQPANRKQGHTQQLRLGKSSAGTSLENRMVCWAVNFLGKYHIHPSDPRSILVENVENDTPSCIFGRPGLWALPGSVP
jgi:hypothetical protein